MGTSISNTPTNQKLTLKRIERKQRKKVSPKKNNQMMRENWEQVERVNHLKEVLINSDEHKPKNSEIEEQLKCYGHQIQLKPSLIKQQSIKVQSSQQNEQVNAQLLSGQKVKPQKSTFELTIQNETQIIKKSDMAFNKRKQQFLKNRQDLTPNKENKIERPKSMYSLNRQNIYKQKNSMENEQISMESKGFIGQEQSINNQNRRPYNNSEGDDNSKRLKTQNYINDGVNIRLKVDIVRVNDRPYY